MRIIQKRPSLAAAVLATFALPYAALAQGGFNGPGQYEITNIRSGKVVDLDRRDHTTVSQFSPRNTPNQFWNIREAEPGFWFIRNAATGEALEAMSPANSVPVRGMPFKGGPGQQWRIEPARDGNALITSRFGKTLDIPNGEIHDGVPVQTYEINGNPNQRFVFRQVGELPQPGGMRERPREMEGPPPGMQAPPPPAMQGPPPAGAERPHDMDGEHRREWGGEVNGGRFNERERMWMLEGDGACFYREEGFRGRAFCVRPGEDVRHLPADWTDAFRSVKFFGQGHYVVVFGQPEFAGRRARIEGDQPDLDHLRSERGEPLRHMSSIRVY